MKASLLVLPALMLSAAMAPAQQRHIMNFDRGWRFHLGDVSAAREIGFNDVAWRNLDLPHDWSIEGPFRPDHPAGVAGGALPGGIGWYRKTFRLPQRAAHQLVFIDFDGVYRNSEVWINGHELGKRPYGYSSFEYEFTPYLQAGRNVLAVRVDNSEQPNSRWYSGSGIYRHVWLVTTDSVHVAHWGTYVTTPNVSASRARVHVQTTIRNATGQPARITLRTTIVDSAGSSIARTTSQARIAPDSATDVAQDVIVGNPTLWSTQRPYLYHVVTEILCGQRTCDNYRTPLGIRTFDFDGANGFSLNGQHIKILGVCNHHDLGALGAAVNERALERQLQILKAMGVNALRTSHNPPAPELLDLADRMGFMVMDEAFDMWKLPKTKYDYHLDWDQWHVRDLSDMVRRDRNHPSVFIWSIGNEIPEQWDSSGLAIAPELAGIVRQLDPTRPITSALNNPFPANYIIRSGALDLLGINYHLETWQDLPHTFPGQKFIGSETTSSLNTRGWYVMPSDSIFRYDNPKGPKPPASYRLSSYDNSAAYWGETHEEAWGGVKKYDFLSGMFIWTGFDYLGEPTPYNWPARSSYFGIVDLAGFPKDAYYMYQSEWTEQPVLHVFPHWNWTPGQTIDVWAYSRADEVELFLNGKSLGVQRRATDTFHFMWRVKYEPGVLHAVARKQGRVIATQDVRTADKPARIQLIPDRRVIRADGKDLSFVTVHVLDDHGVLVPGADNLIRLRITGAARIAAVDNGDEISHAPFQADSLHVFNGKGLVIVRANASPGAVLLTATGAALARASTRLQLVRAVAR